MLTTVFTVLSLIITTTTVTVSGNECECQFNLAQNDFFGDQECFTAYYEIQQDWTNHNFDNATTSPTYSDTLCSGNCGNALNRILYYQDRITSDTRQNSGSSRISLSTLIADYYCVRDSSECGRLTEDVVDDFIESFSFDGSCSSLSQENCTSFCMDYINDLVEEFGCCTRTIIELIRYLNSGRYVLTSSVIFARCGIRDPGPCQRIGVIGQPISSSSGFKITSYDIPLLLGAVMLARLFLQ